MDSGIHPLQLVAVVVIVGRAIDEVADADRKAKLARFVNSFGSEKQAPPLQTLGTVLDGLFARTFGGAFFSRRFLFAAFLLSLGSLVISFLLLFSIDSPGKISFLWAELRNTPHALTLFVSFLLWNICIDAVSLAQTRFFLSLIREHPQGLPLAMIAYSDLALTVALFTLMATPFVAVSWKIADSAWSGSSPVAVKWARASTAESGSVRFDWSSLPPVAAAMRPGGPKVECRHLEVSTTETTLSDFSTSVLSPARVRLEPNAEPGHDECRNYLNATVVFEPVLDGRSPAFVLRRSAGAILSSYGTVLRGRGIVAGWDLPHSNQELYYEDLAQDDPNAMPLAQMLVGLRTAFWWDTGPTLHLAPFLLSTFAASALIYVTLGGFWLAAWTSRLLRAAIRRPLPRFLQLSETHPYLQLSVLMCIPLVIAALI